MEINSIQNNLSYQQPREINPIQEHQKQPVADKIVGTAATDKIPHDEYISSEKASEKPSGLYRVVPDENGNPKVLYDNPQKVKENEAPSDKGANPKKVQADNPDDKSEKCTTNTDKVDREIEKLKEEEKQLEQQIKSAAGDDEKIKELEKKLAAVENELKQKDNNTYRRQNASIS